MALPLAEIIDFLSVSKQWGGYPLGRGGMKSFHVTFVHTNACIIVDMSPYDCSAEVRNCGIPEGSLAQTLYMYM